MTKLFAIFSMPLAMLLFFQLPSASAGLTKKEILSIATTVAAISNEIDKICPIRNCVTVGIGRSPTAFIAQIQQTRLQKFMEHSGQFDIKRYQEKYWAWNIPLSDFKYGIKYRDLTQNEEKVLFSHFKLYLPKPKNNSTILLIDYGITGESLAAATKYLKKYINKLYSDFDIKIKSLLIVSETTQKEDGVHPDIDTILALNHDSLVLDLLNRERFDDLSENGSFRIDRDHKGPQKLSAKYLKFLRTLKAVSSQIKVEDHKDYGFSINPNPYALFSFPEELEDLASLDQAMRLVAANQVRWTSDANQAAFYSLIFDEVLQKNGSVNPEAGLSQSEVESMLKILAANLSYYRLDDENLSRYFKNCLFSRIMEIRDYAMAALEEIATDERYSSTFVEVSDAVIKDPRTRPGSELEIRVKELIEIHAKSSQEPESTARYSLPSSSYLRKGQHHGFFRRRSSNALKDYDKSQRLLKLRNVKIKEFIPTRRE